jgi:hypothetical protein
MIIIKHRVNKIKNLKQTPVKYGVEIDLRSENRNIYLSHDPFKKGVKFINWLKYFNHKIIILNVKEEGLEERILDLLKIKRLNNFFFHDQSFSSLLNHMKKTKVSIRFSEFESLKKKNYLFKNIKWLWLDNFSKIDMNKKFYYFLKKKKVNICLVSPELINIKRKNEIELVFKKLLYKKLMPDAVCTKYPIVWERLQKKYEIKAYNKIEKIV